MRLIKLICTFFLSVFLFTFCNLSSKSDYKNGYQDGYNAAKNESNNNDKETTDHNTTAVKAIDENREPNSSVPQKVYETLDYIRKNNRAPEGYVGGRHFGNFEHQLPKKDENENKIEYQEWDVNPKVEGKNRGTQRLVTGSDGRAWYTNNHYKSFTEVK